MVSICLGCSKNSYITNKKYVLCDSCNYKRLHEGKTRIEVYGLKPKKDKKTNFVNKISAKQVELNKKLSSIKKEIEFESFQKYGYLKCEGCGHLSDHMDKSHLVSIAQNKSLECIKENIQLLCRECHMKWESRDINTMMSLKCFDSNMKIIKRLDEIAYNKIKNLYDNNC